MKMRLFGAAALAILVAVASPLLAQAATMSVNIPFEFTVGGKIHPSGEYRISTSSGSTIVGLSNFDASLATQVLALRADDRSRSSAPSRLVFRRYADRYFLAEIWNANILVARSVAATPEEQELARTLALAKGETVTVLARR